jgi:predicted nucleotidyltransferase/predicted transcriptional regulator
MGWKGIYMFVHNIELMFKKLNLFSRTEMKLLNFISAKEEEMYEREIAREANVSTGSVSSIMEKFAEMGLLRRSKKGRMSFYAPNGGNPLLRQFRVFMAVNGVMPAVGKIAPHCKRIVLFGSCAEGRNTEGSDVDLFVLSREKGKIRRILEGYPKIQAIILDAAEYATLREKDKPLYGRILRGIELYGEEYGGEV